MRSKPRRSDPAHPTDDHAGRHFLELQGIALFSLAAIAAIAALVWLAFRLDLPPPDGVRMAAGREGGGYHAVAERYAAVLARDGIALEIVETAGSVENAALISSGEVDVALLQGGVLPREGAGVEALAAVFLEPFLVFHRGALPDAGDPSAWGRLRVAAGEQGSGTRAAVLAAARDLGFGLSQENLVGIGGADAAQALLDGEVDAAVFVAPIEAPYLRRLLTDETVEIAPIRDVEALARRLSFMRIADIPPAALDYAKRIPAERIQLAAMVATLAARDDLHPAAVDRLVRAAIEVHARPSVVADRSRFPSADGAALPLDPQAAAILRGGPGRLDGIVPYWVAAQVDRIALLIVPILVLALPLLRMLPGIYEWRMRSRIYRRYEELIALDLEASEAVEEERRAEMLDRLDEFDREARAIRVPARYRENAYALRLHIDLVRRKLGGGAPA